MTDQTQTAAAPVIRAALAAHRDKLETAIRKAKRGGDSEHAETLAAELRQATAIINGIDNPPAPAAPERVETLQERASRLVQREVYYCVSALVSALAKDIHRQSDNDSALFGRDGIVGEDDLTRLMYMEPDADDYRDQTPSGEPLEVAQDGDSWKWRVGASDMWSPPFDSEIAAYRDAFDEMRWDQPDGREIYEHWIVSDWLADQLAERGHSVARDFAGLTVWGRPTTGQAVHMDSVIEAITRDLFADRTPD